MTAMANQKNSKTSAPEGQTFRICLACGVVNPTAPVGGCGHLQQVRFEGIPLDLESNLGDVAAARRQYQDLVADLIDQVKKAVRSGQAEIIAGDSTSGRLGQTTGTFVPEIPSAPARPVRRATRGAIPAQRKRAAAKVDPRQLELLVREPPKGQA